MGGVQKSYNAHISSSKYNLPKSNDNTKEVIEDIELDDNYTWHKIPIKITERIQFIKNTYREDLLKYIISKKNYEKIIEKGDRVLYNCWCRKKKYDKITIPSLIYFVFTFLIVLTFIELILLLTAPDNKKGLTIGKICFALAFLIIFVNLILSVYNLIRKPNCDKSFQEYFQESLPEFCEKINSEISKNMRFYYDNDIKGIVCEVKKKNKYRNNKNKNENAKNSVYEEESNYFSKTISQDEPRIEKKMQIHQSDIHTNYIGDNK